MKKSLIYNLYSNCIPVKGINRSLIYDLFFKKYTLIPNDLYDILKAKPSGKLMNLQKEISDINTPELEEYFNFLEQEKCIFYFDFPDQFPEISLIFKSPSFISNAIIEISDIKNNKEVLKMISELNIPGIALIIENDETKFKNKKNLKYLNKSSTQHIELIFKNFIEIDEMIFDQEPRIHIIKIFKSTFEKTQMLSNEVLKKIEYKTNHVNFDPKIKFNINLEFFIESQLHHTYFNRKLYIGKNGEIKNAPECKEIHGYIQDVKTIKELQEIISKSAFQKYWYVHKEITDICKNCEFRHMCIDNRIPIQRTENEWFHKEECNYNPYICKWKGESNYKTLTECGVISNENEFSIDYNKIAEINAILWDEEEIEIK